jgi:septum formation protein
MRIVLGSQSPRRKEIMEYFNIPFVQAASRFDEESISMEGKTPQDYALELACKKGTALQPSYPDHAIVTADTIVVCEGKIFNKPENEARALEYLMALSGKWHTVWTALALTRDAKQWHGLEETRVLFHPLTLKQARQYHDHLVFSDKAGGYAIQNCGSIIVQKIEGSYHNVMGMPINALRTLLLNVGIDLWDCLKSF